MRVVNFYNVMVPFYVSILEEYLRSTYVALLKYSNCKTRIIKNASGKLTVDDIADISNGVATLEEMISRHLSFQNIKAICTNFNELDVNIERVFSENVRRNTKLAILLSKVIEQRHRVIHRGEMNLAYKADDARRDLKYISYAVEKIYLFILRRNKWFVEKSLFDHKGVFKK